MVKKIERDFKPKTLFLFLLKNMRYLWYFIDIATEVHGFGVWPFIYSDKISLNTPVTECSHY